MSDADEPRPPESMTAGLTPMNPLSAPSPEPSRRHGLWRSRRARVLIAVAVVVVLAAIVVVVVRAATRDDGATGPYARTESAYAAVQAELNQASLTGRTCRSLDCVEGQFRTVRDRVQDLATALADTNYPVGSRADARTALRQVRAVVVVLRKVQNASLGQLRQLARGGDVLGEVRTAQASVEKLLRELR